MVLARPPSAAAQMNAVFRVPPSVLAAALVSSMGARSVSSRRRSDRSVHSGEWAASVSESWLTTPRTVCGQGGTGARDRGRVGEQLR